jgi:hypothetical protein
MLQGGRRQERGSLLYLSWRAASICKHDYCCMKGSICQRHLLAPVARIRRRARNADRDYRARDRQRDIICHWSAPSFATHGGSVGRVGHY